MMLNAVAVGILVFLLWDVLSAAWEPIDAALSGFHAGDGGLASAFGYFLVFVGGIAVGLRALVAYDRWMDLFAKSSDVVVAGIPTAPPRGLASWSSARR